MTSGLARSVRVVDDAAALARAAAAEFAACTQRAARARGVATVALSGGSTPRALYARLAETGDPAGPAGVPWESLHVFWSDERHVPPDHSDSNYGLAREALLARVPVPEGAVHRIRTEDPDAARVAARYEDDLRAFFGARPPRLDLVLLGMGADGHTASLFPGTSAVHESVRWVAAPWVPKLGAHRVTLTPTILNQAATVVFLVSGADKAETLRAVLEGERQPDLYPSQAIAPADGELVWLVDRAAAGRLSGQRAP